MGHKIVGVSEASIAALYNIEAGDELLLLNEEEIIDVFDFRMFEYEKKLKLNIKKKNGEFKEVFIEKDEDTELGLIFENDLMSDTRQCSNKCIFCFIDQMPKGLRETLYVKDDDSRLSFLTGNYITLTNMKQEEIDRIIRYRLEPMNISVHTTNPDLRCKMLNNRFAGNVLSYLDDFYRAGLHMNAQIVLCKGINDGEELERTLKDLYKYLPCLSSLSIVPVGLTKYREGLYPLLPFEKEDALKVIHLTEKWQKRAVEEYGTHYVHASDEFYILAGLEFPGEESYDGYLQLENGVGMSRLLLNECKECIETLKKHRVRLMFNKLNKKRSCFATGKLAAPILEKVNALCVSSSLTSKNKNLIIPIKNNFFGEKITVSGLITGQDIISQIKDMDFEVLYLPKNMFRSGEEVMLDGVTKDGLQKALGKQVVILESSGHSLVRAMCGMLRSEDIYNTDNCI